MRLFILTLLLGLLIGCANVSDSQTNNFTILNNTNPIGSEISPISPNTTLPVIAIHISEKSQKHWDDEPLSRKFEGYASLMVLLDSQKIPYVVLSDEDIGKEKLFINKKIKYPIVFSINNPQTTTHVVNEIDRYVQAGGTFFFNANSLTFNKCFMLDVDLSCIREFFKTDTVMKVKAHPLLSHIPNREFTWPAAHVVAMVDSEHTYMTNSRKNNSGSMVVIDGGYIYHSSFRPFWGRAQGNPTSINTFFAMNAIKSSFESHGVPFLQIEPWGNYSAAFTQRFDVEAPLKELLEVFPLFVDVSESYNIPAVFYMLVDQVEYATYGDISGWEVFRLKGPRISEMVLDARDRGMVIGSHSTWHLGPDVDPNPKKNIEQSLKILEEVLGERPDEWVSPNLLAQKHSSLKIIDELGIKTTGDQMIGFLPFFGLSPDGGSRFKALQLPTSHTLHDLKTAPDFLAFSLDHQTPRSIQQTVDQYYNHNGLINIYAHVKSKSVSKLEYLYNYVQSKENVWIATPDEIYDYWITYDKLSIEDVRMNGEMLQFTLANSGKETTAYFDLPGQMYVNQEKSDGSVTLGKERVMITVNLSE